MVKYTNDQTDRWIEITAMHGRTEIPQETQETSAFLAFKLQIKKNRDGKGMKPQNEIQ